MTGLSDDAGINALKEIVQLFYDGFIRFRAGAGFFSRQETGARGSVAETSAVISPGGVCAGCFIFAHFHLSGKVSSRA